jgi:hypothetical protein
MCVCVCVCVYIYIFKFKERKNNAEDASKYFGLSSYL